MTLALPGGAGERARDRRKHQVRVAQRWQVVHARDKDELAAGDAGGGSLVRLDQRREVGVTDEQNAALEDWKSAGCFNELQRAALAFADEIVALRRPTDATFKAIARKLTPAALVELQLSVGFYIMTSKFLETFDIDMQPVEQVV